MVDGNDIFINLFFNFKFSLKKKYKIKRKKVKN
jgi:hypothetical protein